ncbi:2-keto-4-pentenoate hydratase [Sphingopyxis sp.]|uniref:2-keto-4-pentenoate hydratase n=1 Tax=Sphingopyxis sp. TaxID=1908224 RepID=UPI00345B9C59
MARALLAARAGKTPLTSYPGAVPQTMAAAYAIQDHAIRLDGRPVGGWKVGRIADDLADRYGDNRLTGPIFSEEIREESSGAAPAMPVFVPGFAAAEAEVLLRLGAVGDVDYDAVSIRDCIEEVRAGIEIASSPFAEINQHGPAVTASDYGNNKGLVLGPPIAAWRDVDLIRMPVAMFIEGAKVGEATMETMLDGPFGAAAFLVRTLHRRGVSIAPGTWVSSGAITGVHEVTPGQTVEALFDGKIRVGCLIESL